MTDEQARRGLKAAFAAALAHHKAGRLEEAGGQYRRILAIDPQQLVVWNHLGLAALGGGVAAAERLIGRALRLAPSLVEGHCNLAAVHRAAGSAERAERSLRRAAALQPGLAAPFNNLAAIARDQGRAGDAVTLFRRASVLAPDHPDIHCNLAVALLQRGDFAEGWREHEWRLHPGAIGAAPRTFARPCWRGEDPDGRTLLLHGEQGFGDTLQFVRFAAPIAARGARVIVEAPRELVRLLGGAPGVSAVCEAGSEPPPFDLHLSLMSAPHRLGVTLDSLPGGIPYLAPPAREAARWRERASAWPGLKVGLVFAGNPRLKLPWCDSANELRSVAPGRLAPLLGLPGASFISLQKDGAAALSVLPPALRPLDPMAEIGDFADCAALVSALDLVISVDTAVAHLAGALGKPVWILSRFNGCWRWLGHRTDSPWYPTARLFHQKTPGDWDGVVAEVAAALASLLAGRGVKQNH